MPAPKALSISPAESETLFADFIGAPALVLAVSGGPDSTALMVLAARWRAALKSGPKLIAVTVDHGLRRESKREAAGVARLAKKLGLAHRTLRWTGRKPTTGLPQAARNARYRLLAAAARKAGAAHVLTAHTLDDQAETVVIRLTRGSGMTGLAAMAGMSVLPDSGGIVLARPLLDIPKARLIATLRAAKIPFADDPTNRDPKFTRARLRGLMPQLAREGLDAGRLALLARRLKRADLAIEATVDRAKSELMVGLGEAPDAFAFDAAGFARLPAEIALRLLGRTIGQAGCEGPVELGKLETLKSALDSAQIAGSRLRRSLAGAIVTLAEGNIVVERAPPRRNSGTAAQGKALTKGRRSRANPRKKR
ncbi:MAG: tRNA lysidine(34) synthetase TilS [Pseudolabrys sp.]|nr:tRNA lysidine(34) synthetase TilS [Pseudolabrys sp.]MDP2298258.1 tRNA lysidine(34) synthetase TilS [Pseudolabrys sp.]